MQIVTLHARHLQQGSTSLCPAVNLLKRFLQRFSFRHHDTESLPPSPLSSSPTFLTHMLSSAVCSFHLQSIHLQFLPLNRNPTSFSIYNIFILLFWCLNVLCIVYFATMTCKTISHASVPDSLITLQRWVWYDVYAWSIWYFFRDDSVLLPLPELRSTSLPLTSTKTLFAHISGTDSQRKECSDGTQCVGGPLGRRC